MNEAHLNIAAKAAINCWQGNEGRLSKGIQESLVIDTDLLRHWLGTWMLARSNPKVLRKTLAEKLTSLKGTIAATEPDRLPGLISDFANSLHLSSATRGVQTSLVSKFAFSVQPEFIYPYDARARKGLEALYNIKIKNHDYSSYFAAFEILQHEVDNELDKNMLYDLTSSWQPVMSETLFRKRTADKYMMLLGGFNASLMSQAGLAAQ